MVPPAEDVERLEELISKRDAGEITEDDAKELWGLVGPPIADLRRRRDAGQVTFDEHMVEWQRLTAAKVTEPKPEDLPMPPVERITVVFQAPTPEEPILHEAPRALRIIRPTRSGRRTTTSRRAATPRRRATSTARDDGEGGEPSPASLAADLAEQSVWLERRLRSIEGQQADQWDLLADHAERIARLEDRAVADDAWTASGL